MNYRDNPDPDYGEELVEKYRKKLLENQAKDIANGKSKNNNTQQQTEEDEEELKIKEKKEIKKYINLVQQLREEYPNITFEEWSNILLDKRMKFNNKVIEYYPDMPLLTDFELSIKTILNIEDITLPFMGIVFAVPSSLKSQFFKLLRNLRYSYYTDKFTARAFVSHSANVPKEKLIKIDMLPGIKNKTLLTPDLYFIYW